MSNFEDNVLSDLCFETQNDTQIQSPEVLSPYKEQDEAIDSNVLSSLGFETQTDVPDISLSYEAGGKDDPLKAKQSKEFAEKTGMSLDEMSKIDPARAETCKILGTTPEQFAKTYPRVADAYADSYILSLAREDTKHLQGLEDKLKVFDSYKDDIDEEATSGWSDGKQEAIAPTAFTAVTHKAVSDILGGLVGTMQSVVEVAGGSEESVKYLKSLKQGLDSLADPYKEKEKDWNWAQRMIAGGVTSGIMMTLTYGTGFLLARGLAMAKIGLPALQKAFEHMSLGLMAASTYGQSYVDAREKGFNVAESVAHGGWQGFIEYITERMTIKNVSDLYFANKPMLRDIANFMKKEVGSEEVASFAQGFEESLVMPDKKLSDFMNPLNLGQLAIETAVQTVIGAGTQVGAARAIHAMASSDSMRLGGAVVELTKSQQNMALMQNIADFAQNSKLAALAPDQLPQVVEKVIGNDVPWAYISKEAIENPDVRDAIRKANPDLAKAMDKALTNGEDLAVPIKTMATLAADKNTAELLYEDVRFEENGKTVREAKEQIAESAERARAETERVIAEQKAKNNGKSEVEAIRKDLTSKLRQTGTVIGQTAETQAEIFVSFFNQLANRYQAEGKQKSALDLYKQYMPRILAPQTTLNQMQERTQTMKATRGLTNVLAEFDKRIASATTTDATGATKTNKWGQTKWLKERVSDITQSLPENHPVRSALEGIKAKNGEEYRNAVKSVIDNAKAYAERLNQAKYISDMTNEEKEELARQRKENDRINKFIEDFKEGKNNGEVSLGKVSPVLEKFGIKGEIVLRGEVKGENAHQSVLGTLFQEGGKHSTSSVGIKNFYAGVMNPIAVFQSTRNKSRQSDNAPYYVVLITEFKVEYADGKTKNVVIPLSIDLSQKDGKHIVFNDDSVNVVPTGYDMIREDERIQKWIKDGLLMGFDNEKGYEYIKERLGNRFQSLGDLSNALRCHSTKVRPSERIRNSGKPSLKPIVYESVFGVKEHFPSDDAFNQRISTAIIGPQAVKQGVPDSRFVRRWASLKDLMQNVKQFETNLEFMRRLPGMKTIVKGMRNKERIAEKVINRMADNLLFLYNKVPESVRSRTRLWYDGGRKTAQEWATRYGLRVRQTAALIALYSPSNNWYNNLTMAERTLDIYFAYGDKLPDKKTLKRAKEIAGNKYGNLNDKTIKALCDEGNMNGAACILRAWDEVNNSNKLYVQTPEGGRGGYFSNPRAWMASIPRIADAISVIRDGSIDNVSRVIGTEFKVRNFYNNLYDPTNPYAATIDTHQVGASLLRVMSGSDIEVSQNFGTAPGVVNSAVTGQKGTYAFYFEALQRAAQRAGVLPREMQSITWEAIRAMFPAKVKKAMRPEVDAIWKRVDSEEISVDDARDEIFNLALEKNNGLGAELNDSGLPFTAWQDTPYNDIVQETYDRGNIDIGNIVQPDPEPTLSIEVAPATDNSEQSIQARSTWETLTDEEKQKVTLRVLPIVIEKVAAETKTYVSEPTMQLGGWLGTTNYSMVCSIADGGDYVKVAQRLAELLHQDAVFTISPQNAECTDPCKVIRIVLPNGFTEEQIKDLYENYIDKVVDDDGQRMISGMSSSNGMMTFAVDSSKIELIRKRLEAVLSSYQYKDGCQIDVIDAYMGEIKGKQNESSLDDTRREQGIQQEASVENYSNLQQETDELLAKTIEEVKSERTSQNDSLLQRVSNLVPARVKDALNQLAYHSSPFKFDKFTLSHLGEGEGEQAHGYGLYFALTKEVANRYRSRFLHEQGDYSWEVNGIPVSDDTEWDYNDFEKTDKFIYQVINSELMQLDEFEYVQDAAGRTPDEIKLAARNALYKVDAYIEDAELSKDDAKWLKDKLKEVNENPSSISVQVKKTNGTTTTYTVNIPEDSEMLFESLTIDKQPTKVKSALERIMKEHDIYVPNGVVGGSYYAEFSRILGGDKEASIALRNEGVKGIRYNGQQDGECAVVWDENATTILDFFQNNKDALLEAKGEANVGAESYTAAWYSKKQNVIGLNNPNLSSLAHEGGHLFLNIMFEIAKSEDAPQSIKKDVAAILDWFGIKDLQQWFDLEAKGIEAVTPYHEKFARGFEAYLREGKAPSVQIETVFDKFKRWITDWYRNKPDEEIIDKAKGELTPAIRAVMDRMLATEEQIEATRKLNELATMWSKRDNFPGTDAEYRAYLRITRDAGLEERARLTSAYMSELAFMRERKPQMMDELAKKYDADFTEAYLDSRERLIASNPLYKALERIVNPEGEIPMKVSREEVMTLPENVANRLEALGVVDNNGFPIEVVAKHLGFAEDPVGFMKNLSLLKPVDQAAREAAESLMNEQNPDIMTAEGRDAVATAALMNDFRLRQAEKEYDLINATRKTPELLAQARADAEETFDSMKLGNVSVGRYKFDAQRHATKALRASAKGDLERMAKAKHDEVFAMAKARKAADILERKEKLIKMASQIERRANTMARKGLQDAEFLDQALSLLSGYVCTKNGAYKPLAQPHNANRSFAEFKKHWQDLGVPLDTIDETLFNSRNTYINSMTVERFNALCDAVEVLITQGRKVRKVKTEMGEMLLENLVEKVTKEIKEANPKDKEQKEFRKGKYKSGFESYLLSHRKMASLIYELCGFKYGDLAKATIYKLNDAASKEDTMTKAFAEKWWNLVKTLDNLNEKAPIRFGNTSKMLKKSQRIAIALNSGNAGNRQRLEADGISTGSIQQIFNTLTEDEIKFVQNVWDLIDEFWEPLAEVERRTNGLEPQRVVPQSFPVYSKDGKRVFLRGGYYPIKYDHSENTEAAQHELQEYADGLFRGATTSSATKQGHAKNRAAETHMKLLLDLDVVGTHAQQVIHDICFRETLQEVNRLFRNEAFREMVVQKKGTCYYTELADTLMAIAMDGSTSKPLSGVFGKALGYLRGTMSASVMGFSVTTALLQPLGIIQSMTRLGYGATLKGCLKAAQGFKECYAKSEFMRNRRATMNVEIRDVGKSLTRTGHPKLDKAYQTFCKTLFGPMMLFQMPVDVPTWYAAYEAALAEGKSEQDAIHFADQTVEDTQGGGHVQSMSRLHRDYPLATMFYSYFSATYQLLAESANKNKGKGLIGATVFTRDLVMMLAVPNIVTAIIYGIARGTEPPDDEGKFIASMLAKFGSAALGMFVGLREVTPILEAVFGDFANYQGPAVARIIPDATRLVQAMEGDKDSYDKFLASLPVIGDITGLPTTQLQRSLKGAKAYADGETDMPTAVLFGKPTKGY